MPETVTTYTDEELNLSPGWDKDPDSGHDLSPAIRRELRQARILRVERDAAVKRAEESERLIGFAGAGVPQDERGKFFAKAYEGPSDAVAVKAAWDALFPTGSGGTDADTSAAQRIADAGGGDAGGAGQPIEFGEALRAAGGDVRKIKELLAQAPADAGVRLKGLD